MMMEKMMVISLVASDELNERGIGGKKRDRGELLGFRFSNLYAASQSFLFR